MNTQEPSLIIDLFVRPADQLTSNLIQSGLDDRSARGTMVFSLAIKPLNRFVFQ